MSSGAEPPAGSPAGIVPPGGGKENAQQLGMTPLFAAFGRTGTEPVQALCLREAQQRVLSDKV